MYLHKMYVLHTYTSNENVQTRLYKIALLHTKAYIKLLNYIETQTIK